MNVELHMTSLTIGKFHVCTKVHVHAELYNHVYNTGEGQNVVTMQFVILIDQEKMSKFE